MATITQDRGQGGTAPASSTPATTPTALAGSVQRLFRYTEGEAPVAELQAEDGASFILTGKRVIYTGGPEEVSVLRAARLEDVSTVEIARRQRDKRAVIWAVLGIMAAVGLWQVSSNETIGAVLGAAVGVVAIGFIADYWLRPGGLALRFTTPGGAVEGAVGSKSAPKLAEFAAAVEEARQAAAEKALPLLAAPPTAPVAETPRISYPAL